VDPGRQFERRTVKAFVGDSVVDVAKRYGVDIHAACGQRLQCATCHVILEDNLYNQLPPPGVREKDMLETAYTLTSTSRLGCQVCLTAAMDGAVFKLPAPDAKGLVRLTPESPRPRVTTASWSPTPAVAPSMASRARAAGMSRPISQSLRPEEPRGQIFDDGSTSLAWERLYREQRDRAAHLEQQLNEFRAKVHGGGAQKQTKSNGGRTSKTTSAATDSGATDEDDDQLQKLKDELEATIVRSKSQAIRFDEVVGLADAKRVLRESVLWPALGPPELFRGIRGRCRGVLLYGPPGCGKTMLAQAAAAELCVGSCEAATFFHVRPSDVMSKFYGESQKRIAALEELVGEHSPAIVFFDEVDTLLGKRDGGAGVAEHHKGVTNALLSWMDGFDRGTHRVFFIGATNRADSIDEAALRRFGDLVEVGLPNHEQRQDLLTHLVKQANSEGHKAEMKDADLADVASRSDGMSGDDVARLVQQAFLEVIRELPGGVHPGLKLEDVPPVVMSHFDTALRHRVRSSKEIYQSLQKPRKPRDVAI